MEESLIRTMSKPFEIEFKVDAIKLAILFMCWKFKFPALKE